MARKSDIKVCRYKKCRHPDCKINIAEESFVLLGKSSYYHSDCYENKQSEDRKEEQLKADIQLIKNLWLENISNTVVISQLYLEINRLVRERDIPSDYVIFVLQYCIKNKCKLRYPAGLKFYVDRQEIKAAYKKSKMPKIDASSFTADQAQAVEAPKFTVNQKPSGFSSILGRKR